MRSWASRLPTMVERPITTASKPASDSWTVFATTVQASGVHGSLLCHKAALDDRFHETNQM
jgi:hypothetical protein